jgi:predicted metal-dependent hydrolase
MIDDISEVSGIREFKYGRSAIEYLLVYEDRMNLAITVKPDKSVLVRAPLETTNEEIRKRLRKRGKWIQKQINYFDQFHPIQPEREYVSGETHYYLGRQYRLRIRKGNEEQVKLKGKFFIARVQDPRDTEHIKILMMKWYAIHAQLLIDRRAQEYAKKIIGAGYKRIRTEYKYLKMESG